MTGEVTWGGIYWVVALITSAGVVVAGFLIWVYRIVQGLRAEMNDKQASLTEAMKERDSAAQLEKERAKIIEQELRRELSEYQVHAAEKFATKDGVTQAVNRVEGSIQGLANQVQDAVDRLTGRIDKLLDNRGPGPPTTRRTG